MSKRILRGVVVSDKSDKTVIVRVERRIMHPVYKKFMTRSKKYAAHDEENRCRVGDAVRIEESRPVSKTKHWIVLNGEAGQRPLPEVADVDVETPVESRGVEPPDVENPDVASPDVASPDVEPPGAEP